MTNRWPLGPKGWAVNELGKEKQVTLGRRSSGFERVTSTQEKHSRQLRTKASCLTSNEPCLRRRKYAVGLRTRQVYDAGSTLSVYERDRSTTPETRCRSLNATGLRRQKYAVGLRTRQVYDARSTLSVFERDRSTTPEVRCRSSNATGL